MNQIIDINKIFCIKDFIDKQESEANCLLCFTTFPVDDIEVHVDSVYHKVLDKVTDDIIKMQKNNEPFKETSLKLIADLKLSDIHPEAISKNDFKMLDNVKANIKRVAYDDYVQHFYTVRSEGKPEGIWFDDEIYIEHLSYFLILQVGIDLVFCWTCSNLFSLNHFEVHSKEENRVKCTMIDMENEFIREIRPNQFHCGYCNNLKSGWQEMEVHLTTKDHKRNRRESNSFARTLKSGSTLKNLKKVPYFTRFPF